MIPKVLQPGWYKRLHPKLRHLLVDLQLAVDDQGEVVVKRHKRGLAVTWHEGSLICEPACEVKCFTADGDGIAAYLEIMKKAFGVTGKPFIIELDDELLSEYSESTT